MYPTPQSVQAEDPGLDEYLPAGQSEHADAPGLDEYLPAWQFWHAAIEFYPVNGLKVLFQFNSS